MGKSGKTSRKSFLQKSLALASMPFIRIENTDGMNVDQKQGSTAESVIPMVISTWKHGVAANAEAWKMLSTGKSALDSVEQGVRVSESDPEVTSVGYGGYPDRDGHVTLDACIMDHKGNCGSVGFLRNIKNPISVARKVMEETLHIMLCGEGALQFALDQGFEKEDLLTEKSRMRWEEWKKTNNYDPVDVSNHDTIGMLGIDKDGTISGACTTSGLAWKFHGRVGDSPIIGAGLFVDGKVGGATATGKGEAVIKIAGTHLIVELMRQGMSPQKACEEAIGRIVEKQDDHRDFQVGFLAVNMSGEYGAYSLQKGFQYALNNSEKQGLFDSGSRL